MPLAERAVQLGLQSVNTSLHGHTPEIHDSLTRTPGSYAEAIAAVQNLASLHVPIVVNTTINRQNYTHLIDIARLLVKLGVRNERF
jgi:MoaA/NifB/PqqE/SkfB family radical SAM enzyme